MANNDQGILACVDEASLLASDLANSREAFGEMQATISEWAKAIAEALQPIFEALADFDWRSWKRALLEDKLSQWLLLGQVAHFIAYHLPDWAIDKISFDWLIRDSIEEKP